MADSFDWEVVERLAKDRLGVTNGSFALWRARNSVPHRYRVDLIALSAGAVTPDDFRRLDAAGAGQRAAE